MKAKKQSLSDKHDDKLTIEDVIQLGGDQSDIDLLTGIDDGGEFESHHDEPESESIKKSEVEEFIVQLGIHNLSADSKLATKQLPTKKKLKTAKHQHDEQSADAKSSERTKESVLESKKKQRKLQHNEITSTTAKAVDWIANYQHRRHLLVKPGGKWQNERFETDPVKSEALSADVVQRYEEFGSRLLTEESDLYRKQQEASKKSSAAWLKTVLRSGTVADKTAALVLMIQESPVHNLSSLDSLLAIVKKKGRRREVLQTLDVLRDLFISELLLEQSKLKTFEQRPLTDLFHLSSGNRDSHDKRVLMWCFEAELKKKFSEFVTTLETLSHDSVEAVRKKATAITFQLLSERPEQEKLLLSMLVNKLGDPCYKVAAHTAHLLTRLVDMHPDMKTVVVTEVERLVYRPHVAVKAQYYGICFLNTLLLSQEERQLASRLLSIYFTFFKVIVKKGEVESKMLSGLLTGVNRAYPYAKADRQTVLSHIDTLYKIVFISRFNTSLQALMLIYQVMDVNDSTSDRYFMALYRKLLDPALQSSNKITLFLNLLFKSLKNDEMEKRVQAFVKRLLQVSQLFTPPLICASLVLLSELMKTRPTLLRLSKLAQESGDDDDDEHFVDVDDDDDDEVSTTNTTVSAAAAAAGRTSDTAVLSTKSSWLHRNNLTCRPGSYDAQHRNPLYCHADADCTWELLCLTRHYHPSVALFAHTLLKGQRISYDGDPLVDFTMIRFLDRFVYRNPKKTKPKPAVLSAGVRHPALTMSTDSNNIRNIPVNSDMFLVKGEDNVPTDEKFFYRYFSAQSAVGRRREPDDVDSDADEVSDDEFDAFLDKFEHGLEDPDFDLDFASEIHRQKRRGKNVTTKDASSESETESDDGENLSDEEVEFDDSDVMMDVDEASDDYDGQIAGFNEEDVEFSDENDENLKNLTSGRKNRKRNTSSTGQEAMFAAAEDFSDVIDDDIVSSSSLGDMIGSGAVSRRDNAGVKQLRWEAAREREFNRRQQHKQRHGRRSVKRLDRHTHRHSHNVATQSHSHNVAAETSSKRHSKRRTKRRN